MIIIKVQFVQEMNSGGCWWLWWRSERVYFERGDKHVTFTLIGAVSDLEDLNGDGTLNDRTAWRGNRTGAATRFNRHRQYRTLYSGDDVGTARLRSPRLRVNIHHSVYNIILYPYAWKKNCYQNKM